jgi:hypothetical protein
MWAAHEVNDYLAELIRLEGRGDAISQEQCAQCLSSSADYRCEDCFGHQLFCGLCMVSLHQQNPLHRLEVRYYLYSNKLGLNRHKEWNGSFFQAATLKALGLRIQLGHPPGERCVRPVPATNDDFSILHVNGIHDLGLDFCGCETAQAETTQLLRAEWFPATVVKPKSAASFRLLEHFHYLNFESKASAFEFYCGLSRETNNTGVSPPKVSNLNSCS